MSQKAPLRPEAGSAANDRARARLPEKANDGRTGGAGEAEPSSLGWRPWTALGLTLLGTGVAIYLTIAHYTTAAIVVCSSHGLVNCAEVITSPQSVIFGLPVALWGVLWFIAMIGLNLPRSWRSPSLRLAQARLLASVAGMGFVFYLIYVEVFEVHAICLWCTSVHVMTFLLFVLITTGWEATGAAKALATAPA